MTSGSPSSAPTAGLRRAERNDDVAPAHAARASDQTTSGRGGARASRGSASGTGAAERAVRPPRLGRRHTDDTPEPTLIPGRGDGAERSGRPSTRRGRACRLLGRDSFWVAEEVGNQRLDALVELVADLAHGLDWLARRSSISQSR